MLTPEQKKQIGMMKACGCAACISLATAIENAAHRVEIASDNLMKRWAKQDLAVYLEELPDNHIISSLPQ